MISSLVDHEDNECVMVDDIMMLYQAIGCAPPSLTEMDARRVGADDRWLTDWRSHPNDRKHKTTCWDTRGSVGHVPPAPVSASSKYLDKVALSLVNGGQPSNAPRVGVLVLLAHAWADPGHELCLDARRPAGRDQRHACLQRAARAAWAHEHLGLVKACNSVRGRG